MHIQKSFTNYILTSPFVDGHHGFMLEMRHLRWVFEHKIDPFFGIKLGDVARASSQPIQTFSAPLLDAFTIIPILIPGGISIFFG